MGIHLFRWGIMCLLLVTSCKPNNSSLSSPDVVPKVHILEKEKTDYELERSIQVLTDTISRYTIQEIIQPSLQNKFQSYPDYSSTIKNNQHYWGKLQIENRLTNADQYTEWVLSFDDTWTSLDVFIKEKDGSWRQEQNGEFTPDSLKTFAPTARDNLVKLILPPHEAVTIYFRGISERTAIAPSFYIRLKHVETFYDDLLKAKVGNAVFIGFLLMMFFYNLIVFFLGRDRSFIFYSGFLIMVVVYATFLTEDLTDWFGLFPNHQTHFRYVKLSLYLAMMCYLAFIRSFLDLKHLLPKWDKVFKFFIYLGLPLIVLDIIVLLLTNFSYEVEDRITVPYILMIVICCCSLLYPLYKTKDKKGYFIIAGISAISLGAILTIASRVWMPSFSLFYLKAGTIIEVLIFSLGLAYRQREQKQAQQQADFKLKESQFIQEKKQLEADRLKELNEFKTRFYTNITHEFRTPLTVMLGMAKQIKAHPKRWLNEGLQMITRNGQQLLRLINQMLDLAKLKSGAMPINFIQADVITFILYVSESFQSLAETKGIRLMSFSETKDLTMDFDPEKLEDVISNLLSNAIKFTPEGGSIYFVVNTTQTLGVLETPRVWVVTIKIKDTGIGIPPDKLPFVFDRFYQVDTAATREGEGTGIGLALTKELVKRMDGTIEVESEVGKGTTITVSLPIKNEAAITPLPLSPALPHGRQEEESHAQNTISPEPSTLSADRSETLSYYQSPNPRPQPLKGSATPSSKLLIIEDNPDVISYIQTCLETDYQIETARNGQIGIDIALEQIPDIIISDVMMPKKNGYEVCETLKNDERTSHIPIVLLTAKATQADKVAGLQTGADAYLVKPFDKEELLVRLEKLIAIRRQLQARYTMLKPPFNDQSAPKEDAFVLKLRQLVEDQLDDPNLGVVYLCKAANLSHMQVYRKLKALTNRTPSQFIRSIRLQKAFELLKTTDLNVSEVAYDVGFSDPNYFSRTFLEEFGLRPSVMRK